MTFVGTGNSLSCRLEGDVLVIDLGSDGQTDVLFLTGDEATLLVDNMKLEAVGAVGDEIIVADVRLTKQDAWQVLDAIEGILGSTGDAGVVRDGQIVNWREEGF